jgi:hypothetical protein
VPLSRWLRLQEKVWRREDHRNDLHYGDMRRMAAEKYHSLKEFAAARCGARGQFHRAARDRLVEIAVEEFPADAPDDRMLEVLQARMRGRIRQEYGSIVAMLLISVLANLIARAIMEWWKRNHSHKVLIAGWQAQAQANAEKG